jgi:hypothetical protein
MAYRQRNREGTRANAAHLRRLLGAKLDGAATRMVAPDAVQHLHALVEAGQLSANEATRKAPGGWGFAYGPDGALRTIHIPQD